MNLQAYEDMIVNTDEEDQTNVFPDKTATSNFVDFFYSGVLFYRDIYVSVDGGRCSLPLPKMVIDEGTGKRTGRKKIQGRDNR